jgi:hypothetical protein
MTGQAPPNTTWGSCANCTGTQYVDAQGNATGNGTTPVGVNVGQYAGQPCTINGWLIAGAIGIALLFLGGKKQRA